jgi:ribosomal protein S4E
VAELTPFTYGDSVLVIDGEHKGRAGAIVGMNDPDLPSIFTVEFADGGDAEMPLGFLEKLYEP